MKKLDVGSEEAPVLSKEELEALDKRAVEVHVYIYTCSVNSVNSNSVKWSLCLQEHPSPLYMIVAWIRATITLTVAVNQVHITLDMGGGG